ncbi:MAG: LysM peptidoglycan-binding domain-containing protein [Deltaproteobacteria bacterium]|nr:MAG: LysM peptidoglycan-binding domain-containing protein [Deltaproteobacteria bacterium]
MNVKHLPSFLFILMIFIIVFPAHLWAQETTQVPQTRESRLKNWEVVETESGIYYTVKKGDTLWDISQRFSNSPYLWPDLWSDNSQIANPHRIYPGERIRLFRRQDVERHAEPVTEEEPVEAAAPVVEEAPEPEPEAEPEPTPQFEPEEEPLPESRYVLYSGMDQVGFIREKAVQPHGIIRRVRGSQKMISQDDLVYISFEADNTLSPGSRYTVYRTFDPIKDKTTRKYIGIQHYILGIVEIVRTEPEHNYAIGKIIRSFSNIRVDDKVMPYTPKSRKIAVEKTPEGLIGQVIIAENHNLIIGDHTRVFINKGEKDGVRPGQVYSLYYQDEGRIGHSRKKAVLKPVAIGSLLVLHTEETTATVFITKADRNISPGTKISTPFE